MRPRRALAPAIAALAVAASLLVAACGSQGSDSQSGSSPSEPVTRDLPRADSDTGGTATSESRAGSTADSAARTAPDGGGSVQPIDTSTDGTRFAGRDVIATAHLTVTTHDLSDARAKATAAVDAAGGHLYAEQTSNGTTLSTTTLTLKVPPAAFDGVLAELAGLGELVGQSIQTDDVTDQIVDLEVRTSTAEASLGRIRALYERATTIAEVAQLDGELSRREADLERLRAQERNLAGQVDMATITLTLTNETPEEAAATPGFGDGLGGGLDALAAGTRTAALVLGAALPFLVLAALAWIGWLVVGRRLTPFAKKGSSQASPG